MKRGHWLLLAALLVFGWQAWQRAHAPVGAPSGAIPAPDPVGAPPGAIPQPREHPGAAEAAPAPAGLPREVGETLQLIARDGPYPFDRDGAVFGNFERRLPQRPRGWYHEYTVPTPGAHNRGARRIIAGGRPPSEFWYTGDHYETFTRLDPTLIPPGNPR